MQTKHNNEIQDLQSNLDKKSEEYNAKDKENRNKENQSMLERMNLKSRIEELSNNIDSQNKEILSLKESNKKFKGNKESITEKDKAIKEIELKNKELEEKLVDWEKTIKQVTRDAQEKVDLEKHNITLIQQNLENEIKSHQDLKKNYSLLLENLSQQQNSISHEEHTSSIEELTSKHTEEQSKLRQDHECVLFKVQSEVKDLKYQLSKKAEDQDLTNNDYTEKLKILESENNELKESKVKV